MHPGGDFPPQLINHSTSASSKALKNKPTTAITTTWTGYMMRAWLSIGFTAMMPPAIVQDATAAYFADQDTLQQWLEECTEDGGSADFTRSAELFASWKSWSEERNWQAGSAMALSEALIDRGYEKGREGNTGQRGFRRLAVKRR